MKLKNLNCAETQTSNCDETQNLNGDKTQLLAILTIFSLGF